MNYCHNCSKAFEDDEAIYPDAISEVRFPTDMAHPYEPGEPHCPKCGEELEGEAEFCTMCEEWHPVGSLRSFRQSKSCTACFPKLVVVALDDEHRHAIAVEVEKATGINPEQSHESVKQALREYYGEEA